MSELPSSRRQIAGLTPLDRMRGAGVAASPADTAPVTPAETAAPAPVRPLPAPEPVTAPETPSAAPSAPRAPRKPQQPSSRPQRAVKAATTPSAAAGSEKMTTYVPRSVRGRAQTAFEATRYLEGDGSWSEFVATALERETARREKLHNDGKPYPAREGRLPAGRPLG